MRTRLSLELTMKMTATTMMMRRAATLMTLN
jgi:hypothetical protein